MRKVKPRPHSIGKLDKSKDKKERKAMWQNYYNTLSEYINDGSIVIAPGTSELILDN